MSAGDAGSDEARLARLEQTGIIRRPRHSRLEEIVRVPPPVPEPGGDIVAAVLEERGLPRRRLARVKTRR